MPELSDLEKYKIEANDFFTIADGEEKEMVYKGVNIKDNPWHNPKDVNSKKKIPHYELEYTNYPKIVEWANKRIDVLQTMEKFKPGDKIRIKRKGEMNKTEYTIEKA